MKNRPSRASLLGLIWRRLFGLLALSLLAENVRAQVSFEAAADSREAVIGTTLEISFTLKNAEGSAFRAPSFEGFKIVGGPNVSTGMTFLNGKKFSQRSWSFLLMALKEGDFEIGPAAVKADGVTMATKPFSIKIIKSRSLSLKNQPPGAVSSDQMVFVQAEPSATEAVIGQQIVVDYRLYSRADVSGISILQEPRFDGFFVQKLERHSPRQETVTVGKLRFETKIIHSIALFPQQNGDLTVEPMTFQAGIIENGPGGLFGSLFGTAREAALSTDPIKIKCKPLPQPQPAGFSGCVGRFELSASLDRMSLTTDDAAVLTLVLKGDGDPKRFSAPRLSLPKALEQLEPKLKSEQSFDDGEALVTTKTFEYFLLPKAVGELRFVPSAIFFDPRKGRFDSIQTNEIVLNATLGSKPIAPSPLRTDVDGLALKPISKSPGLLFWGAAFLLAAGAAVWFFSKRPKKKEPSVSGAQTTSTTEPKPTENRDLAQKLFEIARKDSETAAVGDFEKNMSRAFEALFSQVTGLGAHQFSRALFVEKALEKGWDPARAARLDGVLKALEAARFGGGSLDPKTMAAASAEFF